MRNRVPDDDRVHIVLSRVQENVGGILRICRDRLEFEPEGPCGRDLLLLIDVLRFTAQQNDSGYRGRGLLEQVQALPHHVALPDGETRHVATGASEARYQSTTNCVTRRSEDNGYRSGGSLSRSRSGGPVGDDEVHLEANEIGGLTRQATHP